MMLSNKGSQKAWMWTPDHHSVESKKMVLRRRANWRKPSTRASKDARVGVAEKYAGRACDPYRLTDTAVENEPDV